MIDLNGKKFGGFRVKGVLGGGNQGMVYSAVSETDEFPGCPPGTMVALKTMPARDDGGVFFASLRQRTSELASIMQRNVVRYYGCFMIQEAFAELHVVVMECLSGESLKSRLVREHGGLDADVSVHIAEGIVNGLAAAAEKGICHRDVKPGNVFLCHGGEVKLIDFEVAKVEGGSVTPSSGKMIGSYDYMAPDFTDTSFPGDVQSDIFSAGVVIHEMMTGTLPYRKTDEAVSRTKADFDFLARWTRDENGAYPAASIAISPRIRRLLAHSEDLFIRSLAPERRIRFADYGEMRSALKAVRFRDLRVENRAYRILQYVGKGGFGEVFKARLRSTGELVAVKHLLNPDYADRFYREAKIMSQLQDPCFVRFLDFMVMSHSSNRSAFIIMSFLPGMPGNSLKDAVRNASGGLPREDVLTAFVRYAHGLAVMHSRGIYHRDIKPSNLYFPEGRPGDSAIMDLGIARDVNGTVTTGNVPGTFDYMSPEVVTAKSRGEAAMDIYALGLCMYEALTGKTAYPRLPRGSAAYAQFFRRAQTLEKPVFDSPVVADDARLLKLLVQMTEPDVSRRLSNAADVERRLRSLAGIDFPDGDAETMGTTVNSFSGIEPSRTITVKVASDAGDGKRKQMRSRMERICQRILMLLTIMSCAAVMLAVHIRRPDITAEIVHGTKALVDGAKERVLSLLPSDADKSPVGRVAPNALPVADKPPVSEKSPVGRDDPITPPAPTKSPAGRVVSDEPPVVDKVSAGRIPTNAPPENVTTPEGVRIMRESLKLSAVLEPVEFRRNRIDDAERMLKRGVESGGVSRKDAELVMKNINVERGKIVFRIINRSDREVSVGNVRIKHGDKHVFVCPGSVPPGMKISCEGFMPVDIGNDADGNTIRITPDCLKLERVPVSVPALEKGVLCWIDDKETSPGVIRLMPGAHECTYTRAGFAPQSMPFFVEMAKPVKLPAPLPWTEKK